MGKEHRTLLSRALDFCFFGSAMVILSFLAAWVIADVLGRFLFNRPLSGTEEIVSTFMIIVVILPIGYVQKKKQHILVEFLLANTNRRGRIILEAITAFLAFAGWALIAYALLFEVLNLYQLSEVTFGPLGLKLWPFYACAFVGVLSLVLQLFGECLHGIRSCFSGDGI